LIGPLLFPFRQGDVSRANILPARGIRSRPGGMVISKQIGFEVPVEKL
jgi:hypothetical protein